MKQRVTGEQLKAKIICYDSNDECPSDCPNSKYDYCPVNDTWEIHIAKDLQDTRAQLAIAVKALEDIEQIRKAGPAFESHFSKLQDIGRITNDALKEIQG